MTAVLDDAGRTFSLSGGQLLLLSMLPVLAFGLTAPVAGLLARRVGVNNAMGAALLLLALSLMLRVWGNGLLLPATFIAGSAIMVVSVLLPRALKYHHANGWWTGLVSVGFGIGAALGAGLARPLEAISAGSLRFALAAWSVPALIAGVMVLLSSRRLPKDSGLRVTSVGEKPAVSMRALVRQPVAVAVALFFGLQALLYFAMTSWLPSLLIDRGVSAGDAALLLAWFSVAGFVPTLLMPVLAAKPAWLKILPAGIGCAAVLGFVLLLVAQGPALVAVVGFLGAVESAAFGLGLALVVQRSTDAETAGSLSALTQGGGFALAATGPLLVGAIHQATGGWQLPLTLMLGVSVLLALAGFFASRGNAVGPR